MNLLQGDVPNNIPLSCNVCPRRPDFSDVSHLLTHIQSKGHLSAYYKLKVKGSSDPDAQNTVDAYDEWYAEFGLEELMRERMSQKDKKKAGICTTSRRSTATTNSSRSTPVPQATRRAARGLREQTLLDPQLNRRGLSASSRSATPLSFYEPANFHRSLNPLQSTWPGVAYLSNSPSTIKQESVSSYEDDEEDAYDPMPRRASRRQANNSISTFSNLDDASEMGDEIISDNAKLKGVIWPGMAIFDSATPDMKRRRNQKKDACVLRALQATSEIVEPTECVYDPAGALRCEREITGLPASDDDLIEGESEPEAEEQEKKRPRRKPRQPLIKKEPNTGRVTRGSKLSAPLYTRTSKGPYFGSTNDGDDDLTYKARSKKRSGLSIHRDNTGPEITFNQPMSMDYLTAGYNPLRANPSNDLSQRAHTFDNPFIPRSHHRQPSWGQAHVTFRPSSTAPAHGHQQTYSTFGGMFSHQSGNTAATSAGSAHHNFSGFAHNFGTGHFGIPVSTNPFFQTPSAGDMWDVFNSIADPADSVMGETDLGFGVSAGEAVPNNALFLSDVKPVIEDEEGTLSAASEH